MALMVLVILLFSSFYIALETHHDCCGEDCPYCECIKQCHNTLNQFGDGMLFCIVIAVPVVFALVSKTLFVSDRLQETLVSNKVRLND